MAWRLCAAGDVQQADIVRLQLVLFLPFDLQLGLHQARGQIEFSTE